MQNHAHQANYTADFVCNKFCEKQRYECGPLPTDSTDRKAALALSFKDFDLSDDKTDWPLRKAAMSYQHCIKLVLQEIMARKRNSNRSAKHIGCAPLSEVGTKGGQRCTV